MKLVPLKLPPGFANTGTEYQQSNRWHAGNLVRFFQGSIQPVGGWAARTISGTPPSGAVDSVHGWLIDNTPVWVVGSASELTAVTVIGESSGEWHDITPTDTEGGPWELVNFGNYLIAVDAAGLMYSWDGDTAGPATIIENGYADGFGGLTAGTQTALSVVVTPERYLLMLGGVEPWSTSGSPSHPTAVSSDRLVAWPTQESGLDSADWEPLDTNTAGSYPLDSPGALRAGRVLRGVTMLWTTRDLWSLHYVGGTLVYGFDKVGDGCGIISKKAVATADTAAYWMGENSFFAFDGYVRALPCDVQDYVFGSLNRTYANKIWAYNNSLFGEVTWHYPSASATSCDRYVTYSYRENHWVFGTLSRAAGEFMPRAGFPTVPVLFTEDATAYTHETGTARTGSTAYVESGPVEIGEGDQVYSVVRLVPDEKSAGQVNVTLYGRFRPLTTETTYGPYTLSSETANVRIKARQFRVRFDEATAADWRVGTMRFGVVPAGTR